jgi:hypothetical protein
VRFRERRITTLTFECYGAIVDWERGACTALRSLLGHVAEDVPDDELVALFLEADRRLTGCGLMPYATSQTSSSTGRPIWSATTSMVTGAALLERGM